MKWALFLEKVNWQLQVSSNPSKPAARDGCDCDQMSIDELDRVDINEDFIFTSIRVLVQVKALI